MAVDTNNAEWSKEEQFELADSLSTDNITAQVVTSTGKYVKVKFYRDNKPLTIFKTRDYKDGDAQKHLDEFLANESKAQS